MSSSAGIDNGNAGYGEKLSLKERFGYAVGDLSTNVIFTAISTFLTFFYTDIAGISAGAVGTIFLVTRIVDGILDIGIGALVDRTKSRHGKARPWIKWMAVPFGLSVMVLFTAPNVGETGAIIYASVTYFVCMMIYSAINIPYSAMNSLMTQDPYQRTVLNITRMVLSLTGGVAISMFTMPVVNAFGGGKMGWALTFGIIGAVSPLLYAITYKTTRERVKPVVVQKDIPLRKGARALLRNKYWIIVLLFSIILFLNTGISSALNIYYAQYILHDPGLVAALGIASILPIIVGILLCAPLMKRIGKRNTILVGCFITLAGSLLILVDSSDFGIVLISTILKTLGVAPAVATGSALLADTVEYGEWRTGARTEGLIFSGASLASKIGSGFGGAIVGWALAIGGYVGGLSEQSDSAITAIKVLYIGFPIVLVLLQIGFMMMYTLEKKLPSIVEELQSLSVPSEK
ncbi:MFS transporter [Paenibacillus sp. S-38]|uniref:MFS transporter n=1 Tax=Paenibacillus sp. S-38 TaxID=3416710 RepID=UPI003CF21A8B